VAVSLAMPQHVPTEPFSSRCCPTAVLHLLHNQLVSHPRTAPATIPTATVTMLPFASAIRRSSNVAHEIRAVDRGRVRRLIAVSFPLSPLAFLLLALSAPPLAAQGEPHTRSAATAVSAPIGDVIYEVTVDSLTTRSRSIVVAMHFRPVGPGPVVLALPAWTPGHYTLLWFARRLSNFSPTQGGVALHWHQLDYQTWQLDSVKQGSAVSVAFDYLADTIDRAAAWSRSNSFGFFNGTNVFMYPVGRGFSWPAQVIIHTSRGWKIATGMTALPQMDMPAMHHDYDVEHHFSATNYHDLVDMPFFIGDFDFDSVAVASAVGGRPDHWVRAATYPPGATSGARMTRLLGWLAKLAPTHARVFDDMPWQTYTVLQITDPFPNGGGLEHQNSQLDEIPPSGADDPFLPGLYSHEMFHAWNVKRLRPADMFPYRYDDVDPTEWLWVSEGVTDYYADLGVVRSGIGDSTGFFAATAGKMTTIAAVTPTALTDASLRPWINPTDGSGGLYYPKGSLAGFMLDVLIRDASDNRRSLDDVMRSLYKSTYKQGRGFTTADWWSAVILAATPGRPAIPIPEVRRRYIEGRDPMPWATIAPLAGLRLGHDTTHVVRVGASLVPDSAAGGMRVTRVVPGSAAAAAGFMPGDILLTLGDITAASNAAMDQFRRRYANVPATTISATYRRGGETRTTQVTIHPVVESSFRLDPDPDASLKAVRIRHGLVTGTTGQ
jgi:predicted metalloprotease with PDZ domain